MKKIILFATISISTILSYAVDVIKLEPEDGDMTLTIRKAIESAKSNEIKIELAKGSYFVRPEYAFEKYCAITNHGNGLKKIIFPMINYKSVEIVGDNAKIICHGQVMPFLFENCSKVNVSGVTVDWDIPFTFLAEVIAVNPKEQWREVKPMTEGFSWEFKKGKINFPNIDGFNYKYLGSTLPFTADTKRVVAGAIDAHSNSSKIEKLPNGNLRIHEKMRKYPPVGSLLSSKGDRQNDRYAPAFEIKNCENVTLDNITVHHALGMGYLFEKSTDITLKNSKVCLSKGSNRVISSTADASHFANCKGDILIDNCTFENMLDDGTNVHGTYVEVVDVIDAKTVRIRLKHFEQLGFIFAQEGDDMWFIKQPDPNRLKGINKVAKVDILNETFSDITFEENLPEGLQKGDFLENKTWNPKFTMRNCTIRNHRARNVVLKTPLKTVIEYNNFSGMMSAILFRGETYSWFESGAVEDVLIQNNTFTNVADCGTPHATLYITPKLGSNYDQTVTYDKNIRFINNTINTSNPKIVWADRVDGLTITGNDITINNYIEASFPNEPTFEFENCKNVITKDNKFKSQSAKNITIETR